MPVRVFYRKSDNDIVWSCELRGGGIFPTTVETDLTDISNMMPDGKTPLGGVPEDYACIVELDPERTEGFLNSDENKIVDGALIIGAERITPKPTPTIPPRDLVAEIDELKARLDSIEVKA